jgi:hypothetical protein
MENYTLYKSLEHVQKCIDKQPFKNDLRSNIIDVVMSTDMTRHFEIYKKFMRGHRISSSNTPNSTLLAKLLPSLQNKHENIIPVYKTNLTVLEMSVLLKCADIGHTCLPLKLHKKWVRLLEEEYFNQGDAERSNNISISPLFDRTQNGITTSQSTFFMLIVLPLYESVVHVYPQIIEMLERARRNADYWDLNSDLMSTQESINQSTR